MSTRTGKILISIVVIFVVSVFAVWIWSVDQMTKSVPEMTPVIQETTVTLSSGTYLIYQTDRIVDHGTEDWANDDTTETTIYRHKIGGTQPDVVVTKINSFEKGGSVIAYPFGTDLLIHRYSNTSDAIVSLDGTVKNIPENWGLLRSKNGRFEVEFKSPYDQNTESQLPKDGLVFRDLISHTQKTLHMPPSTARAMFNAQPQAVSSDGSSVYLLETGIEGPGPATTWRLDVATDTLFKLESFAKLTDIDFSKQTYTFSLNADQHKILVSEMGVGRENEMGGREPGSPSDIYLIDTKTDTSQFIFQDPDFALYPVVMSPDASEWQYGIGNDESLWIGPTTPGHLRENKDRFTQGRLLDWLEHGLVVDRQGNDIVFIDRATHATTVLSRNVGSYNDPDYQTVNYIGSITIE